MNFFEKFCEFFSKEFTAEKFLWNLTLEKISIFYQSLRDYNCGSNRCIDTCRVSKRISWTRRTFWENCFCSRLHFRPLYENLIFNYFWQKNLVFGKIWSIWPIWPADRPMWPISYEPARLSLFKKIYNLAQLSVDPEISLFTL